ncbi:TPA: hypothetical protein DIC39_00215, partial [Patescibacteria group bacterium]|nr:hypothetical protein [Patescibacteria group bacterium]
AASITGIGQSDILLSFIVNISLLIGALWMTKQLGVAGGNIAGSAMGFLQKSGAAIAKAPFKGAKSFATFAERKLYTTTGVGLNPMRAVKAWKAYSERKKLEEEAVGAWRAGTRAEQLFKEGKGRRAVLSLAMGAHEDLYQNYLGWRGIKRLGRTLVHPKTGITDFKEAEEERRQMKLNLALVDSKKNTDFKKVAEQAIRQEKRDKMVNEKVTYAKTRREKGDNEYNYKELTEEDEEGKKKTKTVLFDEILNKRLEQVGLTENSAEAAVGSAELNAYKQIKDKLATEWDSEKAEEDVKNDKTFNNNLEAQTKQRFDSLGEAGLVTYGREVTDRKSRQSEADYEYLKGGGLTKEQTLTRDRQVEGLLAKLVKINQQIATEKAQGKDTRALENLRDTQRSEWNKFQKKFIDPSGFERYQTTDDEKKKNLDSDTFQKTVQNAELEWNKVEGALLSDSEVKRAEQAVETHKTKAEQFQVAPRAYYATRTYRALEAVEEAKLPKHSMEYSEIHNLLDTAIRDKDFVRISSLMKKATKDYNDNEIFNAYGYGSGPAGAEQFRQDYLVGKVGMNEQASMALMSDINYMNEELGHNNTARMYGVKGGAYYLKSSEEQAASTANENLKQDSRRFIQTHNRLGYGYEDPDGTYNLDLSGKLTLAGFQEDFLYRLGRAEVNPSFLMKLTTVIPDLEVMERNGLLTAKNSDGKTISQLVQEVADREIKRGMGRTFEGLIATAARIRDL